MSQRIPARLFGPNHEASGLAVWLELRQQLHIFSHNNQPLLTTPYDRLSLYTTGFDEKGIKICWPQAGGLHECHIMHADDVATLKTSAPTGFQAKLATLKAVQKQLTRKRRWLYMALSIGLALPLLLLGVLLVNADSISHKAASWVSIEQEQYLSQFAFQHIQQTQTLINQGPQWERLNRLGQQLTEHSVYRYQFFISTETSVNAFALPAGIIVFHQGLLDTVDDWSEVAGVMAHEIQHVEQRHGLKSLIKKAGIYAAWHLAIGNWSPAFVEELSLSLLDLNYSRTFEYEADELGYALLVKYDMDPQGMVRFFKRLEAESPSDSSPSWLSTHPTHQERIERLKALDRL